MKYRRIFLWVLAAGLCMGFTCIPARASETAAKNEKMQQEEEKAVFPHVVENFESGTEGMAEYPVIILSGNKEAIQKLQVGFRGQLKIDIQAKMLTKGVTMEVYRDAACTDKLGSSVFLSSGDSKGEYKEVLTLAGIYYLKFHTYSPVEADTELTIIPYGCPEEETVLKSGRWTDLSSVDHTLPAYHKVIVSEAGYIKAEAGAADEYSVFSNMTLCSKKKEALTGAAFLQEKDGSLVYFAVKKGSYYLCTKGRGDYRIKYTFYASADKGGASKEKAAPLKKGAAARGLLFAEDKTGQYDWYRITLGKKQRLSITAAVKANEPLEVKIIPRTSRVKVEEDSFKTAKNKEMTMVTKKVLPAGAYYMRVGKAGKAATGYYELRWK